MANVYTPADLEQAAALSVISYDGLAQG